MVRCPDCSLGVTFGRCSGPCWVVCHGFGSCCRICRHGCCFSVVRSVLWSRFCVSCGGRCCSLLGDDRGNSRVVCHDFDPLVWSCFFCGRCVGRCYGCRILGCCHPGSSSGGFVSRWVVGTIGLVVRIVQVVRSCRTLVAFVGLVVSRCIRCSSLS